MNMVSEAVKISDLWITKKRLFRKGNSSLFLFHFCYYISAIIYFGGIESNSPFFQILSNPFEPVMIFLIIAETSTHLNSYPVVLIERQTLLIGWNFIPRYTLRKFLHLWLLFTYFSSQRYRSRDYFANGIWGNSVGKMIDERVDEHF